MSELKEKAAKQALTYIEDHTVIGVGTGSTVSYLIDALATIKHRIEACVASSKLTEMKLKARSIPVVDLNCVNEVSLYIDGADEINSHGEMIKGGGGALLREKILASVAQRFICIVDKSKLVTQLGTFPIAVEVIPMARSYAAREIVKLGGDPQYRTGFLTDNGNIILDVFGFENSIDLQLEAQLNAITGVVENGLFLKKTADVALVGYEDAVSTVVCHSSLKSG